MAIHSALGIDPLALGLLLAGTGLMLAEALAPGAHFFVLGVALLVAGLVGVLFPPLAAPLVLAAVVLAAGGVTLWAYREFDFYGGKGAGRTSDSSSLRGQTGHVTERVTTGRGQVKLQDGGFNPYYEARSVSGVIEEGTEVIVVDPGGGNVLTVDAIGTGDDIDRELARERTRDADPEADRETETG